jgi:hypothetical protein
MLPLTVRGAGLAHLARHLHAERAHRGQAHIDADVMELVAHATKQVGADLGERAPLDAQIAVPGTSTMPSGSTSSAIERDTSPDSTSCSTSPGRCGSMFGSIGPSRRRARGSVPVPTASIEVPAEAGAPSLAFAPVVVPAPEALVPAPLPETLRRRMARREQQREDRDDRGQGDGRGVRSRGRAPDHRALAVHALVAGAELALLDRAPPRLVPARNHSTVCRMPCSNGTAGRQPVMRASLSEFTA